MFGLFKKKTPEKHIRKGLEVDPEKFTDFAGMCLDFLSAQDLEFENFEVLCDELVDETRFNYHGLAVVADNIRNLSGLSLVTRIPEANLKTAVTIAEQARLYRCIDHICFHAPGSRARFDQDTGELIVGVESKGFYHQYRADTLIDIALYMLENAVHEARSYLGLPTDKPQPIYVDQWDGGYHYGEGFRTYASARDAFAVYLEKHYKAEEISRDEKSILLQHGPVQYEVLGFGWPNAYMVLSATRGFRHIYHDDERYVQVQQLLAQHIHDPKNHYTFGKNFRGEKGSAITYFQPDGTFVLAEFGFGNIRTDQNLEAFRAVAGEHRMNLYFMTLLTEQLPEDLYSDELNRLN